MKERAAPITPTPADEPLCEWLTERFSGEEHAHRIQVCQWINSQRGEVVFTLDSKIDATEGKKSAGKPRLTRERIVEISNKITGAVQADCDALRRPTVYAVLAFHPAIAADSYSRHLIRSAPKNALAMDVSMVASEDSFMATKLLLGLLESERRDKRWMAELMANVVSGSAERDAARIAALEGIADGTWERQAKLLQATEAAISTADERLLKREWNQMKIEGIKDAVGTIKSLLPGLLGAATQGRAGVVEGLREFCSSLTDDQKVRLFGRWTDPETQVEPGILDADQTRLFNLVVAGRAEPSRLGEFTDSMRPEQFAAVRQLLSQNQLLALSTLSQALKSTPPVYITNGETEMPGANAAPGGMSAEQQIIRKVFHVLRPDEETAIKLFGDTKEGHDRPVLIDENKPGIFTIDQFIVLLRVEDGTLPAAALDDLMPMSGKPLAMTLDQIGKARAIMPEVLQDSFAELIRLRQAAQSTGAN